VTFFILFYFSSHPITVVAPGPPSPPLDSQFLLKRSRRKTVPPPIAPEKACVVCFLLFFSLQDCHCWRLLRDDGNYLLQLHSLSSFAEHLPVSLLSYSYLPIHHPPGQHSLLSAHYAAAWFNSLLVWSTSQVAACAITTSLPPLPLSLPYSRPIQFRSHTSILYGDSSVCLSVTSNRQVWFFLSTSSRSAWALSQYE
jgi:hypothetical protein